MGEVVFPDYVEAFIESTRGYIQSFNETLIEISEDAKLQSREYQIHLPDGPVQIVVHRTLRSFEQPIGEYRARVNSPIKSESSAYLRGKEELLNRYATLASLVTSDVDASVICQCLIQPELEATTPALLAVAAIHGRSSIIEAFRLSITKEPPPKVKTLSAWTDLHLEQIHYDYGHLGIGKLGHGYWHMTFLNGETLTLTAVHDNPVWGGGLLSLLKIPQRVTKDPDSALDINYLNSFSNLVDDIPTFGSWCRDEEKLVFVQFSPNLFRDLPDHTDLLIAWSKARVTFASSLFALVRECP